jgi:hypothetical protein
MDGLSGADAEREKLLRVVLQVVIRTLVIDDSVDELLAIGICDTHICQEILHSFIILITEFA